MKVQEILAKANLIYAGPEGLRAYVRKEKKIYLIKNGKLVKTFETGRRG
ncbi:hypothetical protein J7L00_04185 [Candidatus Bathyarchaeota archaeon]|nr:hypothetical protein [Candidatus Bathyarchaeota archaeon]